MTCSCHSKNQTLRSKRTFKQHIKLNLCIYYKVYTPLIKSNKYSSVVDLQILIKIISHVKEEYVEIDIGIIKNRNTCKLMS